MKPSPISFDYLSLHAQRRGSGFLPVAFGGTHRAACVIPIPAAPFLALYPPSDLRECYQFMG